MVAINNRRGHGTYSDLSGKFFTLIPHDFGFKKMHNFIITTTDEVKKKLEML